MRLSMMVLIVVSCCGLALADDIPPDCTIQPFTRTATDAETEVTNTGGNSDIEISKTETGSVVQLEGVPQEDRTFTLVDSGSTLTIEYSSTAVNRTFDLELPLGLGELTPDDLPLQVSVTQGAYCICGSNTDEWSLVGSATLSVVQDRLRLDFANGLQPGVPPCQCQSPAFRKTQAVVAPFVIEAAVPQDAIVCPVPVESGWSVAIGVLLLVLCLTLLMLRTLRNWDVPMPKNG